METVLNASVEEVFAFHESPAALTKLIPPWEPMRVAESSGSLKVGSRVVLRGRVGPMPVEWKATHTEYTPPTLFADRQDAGPFAWWYHRHHMIPAGEGKTILRDEIEYALPMGKLGELFGKWFIVNKLDRMFTYRHQ